MRYLSLFTGIGGFELGIQQAYENFKNKENTRWKLNLFRYRVSTEPLFKLNEQVSCIGYSEIDKYAIQVFKKHFNHKNYGDITKIKAEELPDFDLLVGGFPCQAFSIAGKRRGFKDTRGTLFFDIARILKAKSPRLLVLENVKGLLSHDNGGTFRTIISTLDELGYDLQWQVLNSKNFGVPQNRERVFIVGHLRGTSRPEVFPISQSSQGNLKYNAGVISAREKWIKGEKNLSREFSQGQRIYDSSGISQTLAGNAGGQGGKTGLYEIIGTLDANYYKGDNRPNNKSNRPRVHDKGSIRRLTPTECERLQGFPDNWTEGVSDTQRYKCLGNAVTVNVVREIFKRLI